MLLLCIYILAVCVLYWAFEFIFWRLLILTASLSLVIYILLILAGALIFVGIPIACGVFGWDLENAIQGVAKGHANFRK